MTVVIGISNLPKRLDITLPGEVMLEWLDLRHREIHLAAGSACLIRHALIDGLSISGGGSFCLAECWQLDAASQLSLQALQNDHCSFSILTHSDIGKRLSGIQQAAVFDIHPAVEAYLIALQDLDNTAAIALSIPLLFSENEVISRNAFHFLIPLLDSGFIEENTDFHDLVLKLITLPTLSQDIWQWITLQTESLKSRLVDALMRSNQNLTRSMEIVRISALKVLVAADAKAWLAQARPDSTDVCMLLSHPNPEIASLSWQVIRQLQRRFCLDEMYSEALGEAVRVQVDALASAELEHQIHLVAQIRMTMGQD